MKVFRTSGMTIYDTFNQEPQKVEQKKARDEKNKKDSFKISDTAKVSKKVDDLFKINGQSTLSMDDLSSNERQEFVKTVANRLKDKFGQYKALDIKGHPELYDVVTHLGNNQSSGAIGLDGKLTN